MLVLSYSAPLSGRVGADASPAPSAVGSPAPAAPDPKPVATAVAASATASTTGPVSIIGATNNAPSQATALLAAGDGKDVWIAHGFRNDNGVAGFQLLWKPANGAAWQLAQREVAGGAMGGGSIQDFWSDQGLPRSLVLMGPAGDKGDNSSPVVIGEGGYVERYFADHNTPLSDLPRGALLRAAIGGPGEMFAVMQADLSPDAPRPGEALHGMSATTAPASTPASQPATAASLPGLNRFVAKAPSTLSVYWFPPPAASAPPSTTAPAARSADLLSPRPGDWTVLDPLASGETDGQSAPGSASQIALAVRDDRLLAIWADPKSPNELRVRTLDFKRRDAHWSDAMVTALRPGEGVPAVSRLMTIKIGETLYVFWTVPTGVSVALHGGWLETDPQAPEAERYRLTPEHLLRPMSLESAGQGVSPATDVAAAASANSILVVAQQADKSLAWLLFDNRGNLLSGPTPAEVHATRPEGQIGQNAVVVVMCLMVGLAFMQWRRKVEPLALPAGTAIAPLALRLGALAIDLAVSYILVLVIFSAWENGGYIGLAESWFAGMSRPEDLFTAPQFPTFAGIYLLQVTLGEMFFRRSVGKALTGLQVLMLDGKSPTVAAILVRNLLRLPECIMAIGLLFALLSDRKQRLGDSLARTVVVSQPGPETPKDPDQ